MKYEIGKEYTSEEIGQSKPVKDIGYYTPDMTDNFAYLHTFEKKEASHNLIVRIFTRKKFLDEQFKFRNNKEHHYFDLRNKDML